MASISMETKIHAVEQCYAGAGSLNQIAERFGARRSTLRKWLLNYDLFGAEGCQRQSDFEVFRRKENVRKRRGKVYSL